jgi:hypothetical protein
MAKTTPAPDVDPETGQDVGALTEAVDELRAENDRLRAELDELRLASPSDGSASFTTDAVDRRREQAEHEQAVMFNSEGARLDREQQENQAQAEGRPVGRDVRLADTPTSAMNDADRTEDDEARDGDE